MSLIADVNLGSSLDVVISHFALVGGQATFLEECGGGLTTSDVDILSRKHEKLTRVSTVFAYFTLYISLICLFALLFSYIIFASFDLFATGPREFAIRVGTSS